MVQNQPAPLSFHDFFTLRKIFGKESDGLPDSLDLVHEEPVHLLGYDRALGDHPLGLT